MTSTIQDRLPLNRVPLDKWSTREQLCLASAVSCSGDQNWMSVSRTLKLVCGNGSTARPADWFSQKHCAVQYGQMLENVETPKRNKRTSESPIDASAPTTVETPTNLILHHLNDERIQELKAEIRKEQEEFAHICKELKTLQSGTLNEEQFREMWGIIEKQQEQERIEEMKLENQFREREQHRLDMQSNWRTLTPVLTPIASSTQPSTTNNTSVDMDLEDIAGDSSSEHGSIVSSSNQLLQKSSTTQPATSPLLSSLLKTPSSGTSATTPISASSSAVSAISSARSSAPTITTLLTCGSIPNKNQPAITLKANIPSQKAAQLLSSPISGPPTITSVPVTTITAQNLLSPSQAAPTLSMLLEKNKVSATPTQNIEIRNDSFPRKSYVSKQSQLEEIPNIISDDNKDEIPMDLDEDLVSHIEDTNVNILSANDSDEPDPNEEQQLLEVFKNIGNIDELDIDVSAVIDDEEVDFLKDMGADSPIDAMNMPIFERKVCSNILPAGNVKENDGKENARNVEDSSKTSSDEALPSQVEKNNAAVNSGDNKLAKGETISSDDSNDNIPLAAVAAQEKENFQETDELTLKNDDIGDISESNKNSHDQTTKTLLDSFEEDNREHDKLEQQLADLVGASDIDETKNLEEEFKSPVSENSDIIIIPTDDDDSCGDKIGQRSDKITVDTDAAKIKKDLESDVGTTEVSKGAIEYGILSEQVRNAVGGNSHDEIVPLPPTISIADTDEDSSTTDISIVTRKDDKPPSSSVKHNAPQARKSLHEPVRQDQHNKTDDESTTQFSSSSSSSVTPARPPLLRKLRERDRSESPMIEGESHMASNNATAIENLTSLRLRRRCSSTPVNDSIPNSPASSDRDRDDLDARVPKKTLLSIFHALQYSKNASTLQRALHEDVKFDEVCLRPMDMLAIRKHIEAGTIRNVNELQRDIMLMCQNGLMLFKSNTSGFIAANAFMQECQAIREFVANSYGTEQSMQAKDNNKDTSKSHNVSGTSSKSRSGSRKSQRIS